MSSANPFQELVTRLSGGFVFAFHEIQPQKLAEFIDCVRPAQAIHLSELVQRTKAGKSTSGVFAITVDDGIGDNVRSLARLLAARAWPATFHVPTQYLDTGEGMMFQWWRRLKPLLPKRKLDLKSGAIDLSRRGAVDELSKKMERLWYTQRLESYLPVTMELVELVTRETGMTRAQIQPPPPITWPEVAELSKNDLIRFESHGESHIAMASLSEEELVLEMKRSRDILTERTGRECRHLAYPFGNPQSIGAAAPEIAKRFYDSATTMSLGSVEASNPWLLPRIPLYPENSTLVARLKILLKCASLRPLQSRLTAANDSVCTDVSRV